MPFLLNPFTQRSTAPGSEIGPLQIALLVSLSVATLVWAAIVIAGAQTLVLGRFLLLLGFYGTASATFLFTRIRGNTIQLFELPVFITVVYFLEFGLAPLASFLDPNELDANFRGDYTFLLRALLCVILGMMAFWFGSQCFCSRNIGNRNLLPEVEESGSLPRFNSVLLWGCILYLIAFAAKLYLLQNKLFAYTASLDVYYSRLAEAQVLGSLAQLGACALVILAIEKYCHPSDSLRKWLFWLVLGSECLWGLISGMRSVFLQTLLLVALVSSLIQRRLRRDWLVIPIVAVVLLFPVYERYRGLIRSRGATEVSTVTAARRVGAKALSETARKELTPADWFEAGWHGVIRRLDLLRSVGEVLALGPRASWLEGEERYWMIPIYPFIPRFVWPTKPVLDKGARFTVALGGGRDSSTALTYPGDLYLEFGLPGVFVGMFLLGVVCQWLSNAVGGRLDKGRVFFYAMIFLSVANPELDVFSFWTSLVKSLAIVTALGWIIYRPGSSPGPASFRVSVRQPCGY